MLSIEIQSSVAPLPPSLPPSLPPYHHALRQGQDLLLVHLFDGLPKIRHQGVLFALGREGGREGGRKGVSVLVERRNEGGREGRREGKKLTFEEN